MSSRCNALMATLAFALLASACGSPPPPDERQTTQPTPTLPLSVEDLDVFPRARVRVEKASLPLCFEAPLPISSGGLRYRNAHPPWGPFRNWVCRGRRGARERLVSAITRAAQLGTLSEDLAAHYRSALDGCDDPSLRPWLREVVDGASSEAAVRVLAPALSALTERSRGAVRPPSQILPVRRRDLTACARGDGQDPERRADCLAHLAYEDRAAALAVAGDLTRAEGALGVLARSLVAFPEPAALHAQLRAWGLVSPSTASPPTPHACPARASLPLTVREAMAAHDCLCCFGAHEEPLPEEHDALLDRLSSLAGPELQDVYFLERRPAPETSERGPGQATLHAYTRGYRYAVSAGGDTDGCDVEAALGLLNAILSRRKSDLRYARLDGGRESHAIVAASSAGLLRARSAGLLAFGPPWDTERMGPRFEALFAPSSDQDHVLD